MRNKVLFKHKYRLLLLVILFGLLPSSLLAKDNKKFCDCIDRADKRIIEIRSLPALQYLQTLDGQSVLLNEFYYKSLIHFPRCLLYKKFYYWKSEIKEVVSKTKNGKIKHKIRCYNNCRSALCPEMSDPLKTHGDVAEFYDPDGNFVGLGVYMGSGKYCALPYGGYNK